MAKNTSKKLTKAEIEAISRPRGAAAVVEVAPEEDKPATRRRHGKTYTLRLADGKEVIFDTDFNRSEVYAAYPKCKIIKEVPYITKAREETDSEE